MTKKVDFSPEKYGTCTCTSCHFCFAIVFVAHAVTPLQQTQAQPAVSSHLTVGAFAGVTAAVVIVCLLLSAIAVITLHLRASQQRMLDSKTSPTQIGTELEPMPGGGGTRNDLPAQDNSHSADQTYASPDQVSVDSEDYVEVPGRQENDYDGIAVYENVNRPWYVLETS